jgi:hypothetical protein
VSAVDSLDPRMRRVINDRRRAIVVVALAIFAVAVAYLAWRGLSRGATILAI